MSRILLMVVVMSLTACTSLRPPGQSAPVETRDVPSTVPPPADGPVVGPPLPPEFERRESTPPPPEPSAPAAALLTQVDQAVAAGDLDRAAALAERALRIAPRDASAWYALANVQFRQRRYADAEGSAQRALSFADRNQSLVRTINALLANIRSAR